MLESELDLVPPRARLPLRGGALLPILHGTSGIFIGIGLARFSFTPVIPLLIRDGWYTVGEAQLLGAWGLAGYLIGGLAAQRLARLMPPALLSALMAGAVALSFLIGAIPVSYLVAALWRFVAGFAGAVLMIAGTAEAAARLAEIGAGRRSGILFAGVGGGAVVSALLIPVFEAAPVSQISLALLAIATASLALHVWAGWNLPPRLVPRNRRAVPRVGGGTERALVCIIVAYAMDAAGATPHVVYLVDYATREVGMSAASASFAWAAFGIGATVGPLILMRLSHRILIPVLLLKSLAVVTVTLTTWPPAWAASAFIVGFCTPGIAVLVSSFVQHAAGPASFIRYWALATTAFAFLQMVAGFLATMLSQATDSYRPVFLLATGALLVGACAAGLGKRFLNHRREDD